MPNVKQTILNMLELYRNMPFLWDKRNKDYANQKRRMEGYKVLLKVYKRYDEDANIKILTKKLQNLRTTFNKELKKVKEAQQNGDVYEPTLWYYHSLTFLEENGDSCIILEDPLEKRVTLEIENCHDPTSSDEEATFEIKNESSFETVSPPRKKKKKHTPLSHKRIKIANPAEESMSELKYEECEILGKAIGLQMRDLNKKQLMITQKLISDTIYYGKMGLLTEDSYIGLQQTHANSSTLYQHPGSPSVTSSPK